MIALMMAAVHTSETTVYFYDTTRFHIQKAVMVLWNFGP
jgi:hypothetical protein